MNRNTLPEEKLLRLIRGDTQKADRHLNIPSLEPDEPKARNRPIFMSRNRKTLLSERVFLLILACSCVCLPLAYIEPLKSKKDIQFKVPHSEKIREKTTQGDQKSKPFSFYVTAVSQRDIFSAPRRQENKIITVKGDADSIKDINLVGIIFGKTPQAVIENKKTKETYTLSKGETIGEFQLEEIQQGKVILNSNERKYELNI